MKQKISDFFRTFEGTERFVTIRSNISTVRKQGQPIFQGLKWAIADASSFPLWLN